MQLFKKLGSVATAMVLFLCACTSTVAASEIDLNIPTLDVGYSFWGYSVTGAQILLYGLIICGLGAIFGLYEFFKIKKMPVHKSMADMAALIYETCKTYMKQQALLLIVLEAFIAACIFLRLKSHSAVNGLHHFIVVCIRHFRLIHGCLVRHAY